MVMKNGKKQPVTPHQAEREKQSGLEERLVTKAQSPVQQHVEDPRHPRVLRYFRDRKSVV